MSKRIILDALLVLLLPIFVQCKFANISRSINDVCRADIDNEGVLYSDSVLMSAPVLSDNFFSDEKNVRLLKGVEIRRGEIERLFSSDKGFVFPRGLRVSFYDLNNRYMPNICVYLVGKWEHFGDFETPIVKCVNIKEKVEDIYLLVLHNGCVLDALLVASVSEEYDQYNPGPLLSERLSNNTISVFSISPAGKRCNEVRYRFFNRSFSLL